MQFFRSNYFLVYGTLGNFFAIQGAYLSASIANVATIEGADFTDAQMPEFTLKTLCERADIKGINPKTGASTSESLMCP